MVKIAFGVLLLVGAAQGRDVTGEWRGRSTCLVGPPCTSEIVVYDITRDAAPSDSLSLKADKIVNGQREEMGTLRCGWKAPTLTCHYRPTDTWTFTLRGDTLTGALVVPGRGHMRHILVTRAK